MPYPFRCSAVKSFPQNGKCPDARPDKSRHYYCHHVKTVFRENGDGTMIPITDYLPCLFQKRYRKEKQQQL